MRRSCDGSGCSVALVLLLTLLPLMLPASEAGRSADEKWRSAIMNDDTATLRSMLRAATVPDEQLAVLSANGKSALMIACKMGDLPFVVRLLELGADEHAKTETGGTAFMFASLGGHDDIVRLLHGRAVDINAQGANGWSATTIAAAKGYADLLVTLQNMGANINAPDVYRWTPLMRAVDNGHMAAVGVLLKDARLALDSQDETGNTALHHAVSNGSAEMVRVLLAAGIDRQIQNKSGLTAAQLVSALPNSEALSTLFSSD